jgi:GH24 family phage-related lysozyme (muramidase)
MASSSLKQRIKRIQKHLGTTADGIIGPNTLTKIEQALGMEQSDCHLKVSKKGLKTLMQFEISSKSYYTKKLSKCVWPGGKSGVTIGIGYDLGYVSKRTFERDWSGLVSAKTVEHLKTACGKKGKSAKNAVSRLKRTRIKVPLRAAEKVFYKKTLPKYARQTRRAFPGVEDLPPDAQAMLLSLVYNRGASLSGSRRKEMKTIRRLVKKKNLHGIAEQYKAMKRLWENKGLEGLLKRRDKEARLIKAAKYRCAKKNIVML